MKVKKQRKELDEKIKRCWKLMKHSYEIKRLQQEKKNLERPET